MINALKTPLIASCHSMGYGGTRFPHVDMHPIPFLSRLSRDVNVNSSLRVISRPVDMVLNGFYCVADSLSILALASCSVSHPPLVTRGEWKIM